MPSRKQDEQPDERTETAEAQAKESAPAQATQGPREPGVDRGRDITNEQLAGAVHRVPGSAVETQRDRDVMTAFLNEERTLTRVPEPPEVRGIDTTSPERNLQTRSNIVSDGPGTTGYVGTRQGPGSEVPVEDLPLSVERQHQLGLVADDEAPNKPFTADEES